ADAPAAPAAAPDSVRVADEARGRCHRPMEETGPAAARDPPRHDPSPARGCGRKTPHARRRRVPARLRPPRPGRLGERRPRHAARPWSSPRPPPPAGTAGRDTGQLHAHPAGPARTASADYPGLHIVVVKHRGLVAAFDGGRLTSDAGLLWLAEADA